MVEWTEHFSDGRWEIKNSNSKYEQLGAFKARFMIEIPANSKKEISFSASIEKN